MPRPADQATVQAAAQARLAILAAQVIDRVRPGREAGGPRPWRTATPTAALLPPARPPQAVAVVGGSVADVTAWPSPSASLTPGGSVPGQVVLSPGGVGRNMATAAAALLKGAPPPSSSPLPPPLSVSLLSAVGDDALGRALWASLPASGLDPACCVVRTVPGTSTPAVVTLLDGRGEVASSVADFEGGGGSGGGDGGGEACGALVAAFGSEPAAASALAAARVVPGTLVALDGNLSPAALAALAAGLRADGGRLPDLFEPVSPAKAGRAIAAGVRVGVATPNAAELGAMAAAVRARGGGGGGGWMTTAPLLLPAPSSSPPSSPRPPPPPHVAAAVAALAGDAAAVLGGRWARGLVVTLGGDGAVFFTREGGREGEPPLPLGPHAPRPPAVLGPLLACHVPALPGVTVTSAVGAGDALAGGLLAAAAAAVAAAAAGAPGSLVSVPAAVGLGAAAAAQVVACREAAPALDGGRAWREGAALAGRAVWWAV